MIDSQRYQCHFVVVQPFADERCRYAQLFDILTVSGLSCHPKPPQLRQLLTGWARSGAYATIGILPRPGPDLPQERGWSVVIFDAFSTDHGKLHAQVSTVSGYLPAWPHTGRVC